MLLVDAAPPAPVIAANAPAREAAATAARRASRSTEAMVQVRECGEQPTDVDCNRYAGALSCNVCGLRSVKALNGRSEHRRSIFWQQKADPWGVTVNVHPESIVYHHGYCHNHHRTTVCVCVRAILLVATRSEGSSPIHDHATGN